MPKAPRKEVSTAPFPFVRQFTAPPFFVDIDDAKLKSKLLLEAVQQSSPHEAKAPVKRKIVKKRKAKTPAKKGPGAGKR